MGAVLGSAARERFLLHGDEAIPRSVLESPTIGAETASSPCFFLLLLLLLPLFQLSLMGERFS